MRIIVTGAGGQVGREVVARLADHEVIGLGHDQLDVGDRSAVLAAVTSLRPDSIIHCAAWTAVDACEGDPERATAINALGPRWIAEAARRTGAHVVALSTDYVFDGAKATPYDEWDTPNPQSVYGRSKLAGELELGEADAVVRTSWVCGRHGANMVKTILRLAADPEQPTLRFVDDQRGHPTIVSDLAGMLRMFAVERLAGTWHVTNQGAVSWFEFAQCVLTAAGDDPSRVQSVATKDLQPPRPAPRPANSVLDNAALRIGGFPLLPDFRDSLAMLVRELRDPS